MHILCVGISHRTASVELRERVAMGEEAVLAALRELHGRWPGVELATLSTCNRTEFYLARPLHGHPRLEEITGYLASSRGVDLGELSAAAYHHDGERALMHAMRVASGLDSMVFGEGQILGQVRRAYELARQAGTAGRVLHKLFQSVIAAAKRVRTETRIGEGRSSVSSAAVDFARHLFSRFDDKMLLVIGAGKMTELTLGRFAELGPGRVVVCNRSYDRARELAGRFRAVAEPFERLQDLLGDADIVISSTGSQRPIVTAAAFRPLLKLRRFRPIFIIDIAVPRDFEAAVGELNNVYLYDMDDLQQAIADQMALRDGEVTACESIISQTAAEAYAAVQMGDYNELIRRLREVLHEIGAAETRRTLNRLLCADASQASQILDEHTQRLVNKILHRPLSELGRGSAAEAAMNATALRRLFNLDQAGEDLNPPESAEQG